MNTCKTCKHFEDPERMDEFFGHHDFYTGYCDRIKAFDTGNMKSNEIAIPCGHDGPIYFGEDFGCIFYEAK